MAAVLVQVADAVVELLNAVPSPFSQKFLARLEFPTWKLLLPDLKGLRVDVVPGDEFAIEFDTRSELSFLPRCVVVIRYRFKQSDRNEETEEGRKVSIESISGLLYLSQEIETYLGANKALSVNGNVIAKLTELRPLKNYSIPDLQQGQFTSLIRATYTT